MARKSRGKYSTSASSNLSFPLVAGAVASVLGIGYLLFSGGSTPKKVPAPKPSGDNKPQDAKPGKFDYTQWNYLPLPADTDVAGNLTENWGITPKALIPLFVLAEQVSGIRGIGRLLPIIARRESAFVFSAHNSSDYETERSEAAYNGLKDKRPLKYGDEAAAFGSGGLFGLLAPYFLWTGYNELKEDAPLMDAPPEVMYFPRVAVFAALGYAQRVLANYDVRDHLDIKVGWANPSLLSEKNRGGETYNGVRKRFAEDIAKVGIDIGDTSTIPDIKLMREDAKKSWPGIQAVFNKVVGTLPTEK